MCGADWTLILEYAKVVLSWPVVAVVLTLYLATRFRDSLDGLMKRVTKASIPGVQFEANAPQTTFLPAGIEELAGLGPSPTRDAELPPALRDDPGIQRALEFNRRFPIQTLLFHRQTVFWLNYERVFIRIYGTQVSALVDLETATAPVSLTLLEKHHALHLLLSKSSDYPSEAFFGFLETYALIERLEEQGDRAFVLTQNGREFLEYIRTNYPADWNSRAQ